MELYALVAAIFVGDSLNIMIWNQQRDSCDTLRIPEAWSAGSQDFCTLPHLMPNWIMLISIQWSSARKPKQMDSMDAFVDRGHLLQVLRHVAQWPNTVESLEDPLVGLERVSGLKALDVLRWVEMDCCLTQWLSLPRRITFKANRQSQRTSCWFCVLF